MSTTDWRSANQRWADEYLTRPWVTRLRSRRGGTVLLLWLLNVVGVLVTASVMLVVQLPALLVFALWWWTGSAGGLGGLLVGLGLCLLVSVLSFSFWMAWEPTSGWTDWPGRLSSLTTCIQREPTTREER